MIPSHGLICQTWTYPTRCWSCRARIHVLQCSCGSAVLFDALGNGWPIHACGTTSARIRRIIRSDAEWARLRIQEQMEAILPGPKQWVSSPPEAHRGVPPLHFVATVEDPPAQTKRIARLDEESPFELAAMKMRSEARSYAQVTLRDTASSPHRVYPAIVKRSTLPGRLRRNLRVGVTLEARGLQRAEWFVLEIVALPESA